MLRHRFSEGLVELQDYLDVAGTLERIGGSIEVYNRILSTFYNQNQNAPEELKIKFSKNYRTFRARVHNIRTGAQNIGASELVSLITRIDSAINIGNKGYVRDNLTSLVSMLDRVLDAIASYLDFAAGQQGITDEEYAAMASEKPAEKAVEEEKALEPEVKDQIDSVTLKKMRDAAMGGDSETLASELERIRKDRYGKEDTEFIQALTEQVEEGNMEAILDMIGTYVELKKM